MATTSSPCVTSSPPLIHNFLVMFSCAASAKRGRRCTSSLGPSFCNARWSPLRPVYVFAFLSPVFCLCRFTGSPLLSLLRLVYLVSGLFSIAYSAFYTSLPSLAIPLASLFRLHFRLSVSCPVVLVVLLFYLFLFSVSFHFSCLRLSPPPPLNLIS